MSRVPQADKNPKHYKYTAKHRIPSEIAKLAERGWKFFPLSRHDDTAFEERERGKVPPRGFTEWQHKATSDLAQLTQWARLYPGCNWALATGKPSGMVAVDIDGADGRVSRNVLEYDGFAFPATLTVTTGRADGGEHMYYALPADVEIRNNNSAKLGAHIDVRGTRGYVVAPGSTHATSKQYAFVDPETPLVPLPDWMIERLRQPAPPPSAADPDEDSTPKVSKGKRTNLLVSLAGTMHKRGMSSEAIEAALQAENAARCEPPLPEKKVRDIARDIVRRYPPIAQVIEMPKPKPAAPPIPVEEVARLTGKLIETCRTWILRFVVLGKAEVTVLAFWLLHSWAFDTAVMTPYIHVCSPEKESGKTTLLRVLKAVARSPRFSSSISASALGRVVGKDQPSLFLDELDAQMKGDREKAQDIRGVLNGGFEIDGTYTRCVGKNYDVVDFPTFSPKVLAGIGELWDTVESRAIRIEMRRRVLSEVVEPFRQRRIKEAAAPIAQGLQDWSGGVKAHLEPIEVADVPGLGDRQMDISEPLLQIAQLAGDEWREELATALQSIFKVSREDGSASATLLSDIRDIFATRTPPHIPSKELAAALNEIEGRPWADWSHGKGLSANNLARQLKKYKIYPHVIWVAGEASFRGYETSDFADAWKRYCPSPPVSTVRPLEPASPLDETEFSNRKASSRPYSSKTTETRMDSEVLHPYGSKAGGTGKEPVQARGGAPPQAAASRVNGRAKEAPGGDRKPVTSDLTGTTEEEEEGTVL
jgi:hypothetical protein